MESVHDDNFVSSQRLHPRTVDVRKSGWLPQADFFPGTGLVFQAVVFTPVHMPRHARWFLQQLKALELSGKAQLEKFNRHNQAGYKHSGNANAQQF